MHLSPLSLLALGALGLGLLACGLRGRRVSDEPRCRKCRYNLTGLSTEKCPECGSQLGAGAVSHGSRRRRPAVVAFGAAVLAIALPLLAISTYFFFGRINPYPRLPFPWVLEAAERAEVDALAELEQRTINRVLNSAQIDVLAEAALREQAVEESSALTQQWIDILEDLDSLGQLKPAHRTRYLEQFIRARLEAKQPSRAGDPVPLRVWLEFRGPTTGDWVVACRPYYRASGAAQPARSYRAGRIAEVGSFQEVVLGGWPPTFPAGSRTITAKLRYVAGHGWEETERLDRENAHFERELSATIEVLPADSPDPLTAIDDPDQIQAMQESLALSGVLLLAESTEEYWGFGPSLEALMEGDQELRTALVKIEARYSRSRPFAIGAEAILLTASGNFPLSGCQMIEAHSEVHRLLTGRVPAFADEEVALLLAPNPERVRVQFETRYWGPPILLGPEEVVAPADETDIGAFWPLRPGMPLERVKRYFAHYERTGLLTSPGTISGGGVVKLPSGFTAHFSMSGPGFLQEHLGPEEQSVVGSITIGDPSAVICGGVHPGMTWRELRDVFPNALPQPLPGYGTMIPLKPGFWAGFAWDRADPIRLVDKDRVQWIEWRSSELLDTY